MMWSWGPAYGGGMWFGMLMMVVFWGAIAALFVFLLRTFGARPAAHDSAMETLRRRLATGEITAEEYERLRKALQG